MSKQVKKTVSSKNQSSNSLAGFDLGSLIPSKFRTLAAILGIIILMVIFYSPVMFGDKTIDSGDVLQMKSTRAYIDKDRDGFSLWNPYLFGGMPAYAVSTSLRWFDFSAVVYSLTARAYSSVFSNYEAIYTLSFLIMAITAFFFMRSRGAGHGVSFLVAAAMIFSSGLTVLYFIGHMTKIMSLALFPFILMMLLKFQKEIKLLDVLLLMFGMHLLVLGAHVQIVYYIALLSLIYFIFYFIYSFVKKDKLLTKQLLKSLGVMSMAAVFAVLMSFDTYYSLYEYKPYSTRGAESATENASVVKGKTETEQYAYNTGWSFSPGEIMTFVIPSYFGFGKSTPKADITNGQEGTVHTYFGQMESVDSPMYMGIIVLILALFAFFVRWKEPFIKFCAVIAVFFLLISFGKNFPVVYDLLYKYLPVFDTFRVPSMILHVLQVIVPILAGFAVMRLIDIKNENKASFINKIKISAIVVSVFTLLSFILSSAFSSWMTGRVNEKAQVLTSGNQNQDIRALADYISGMFVGDIHINLILVALLFWSIYLFLTSKLSKTVFIAAVCVFALFDLFRIGNRAATFQDAEAVKSLYVQPGYVKIIKDQKDIDPFRIASLKKGNTIPDIIGSVYYQYSVNYHTYFQLEDIYGYSSVKPRAYNDILANIGLVNITLWRMMGVKYIVTSGPVNQPGFTLVNNDQKTYVYRYEQALPRAYFVDSVGVKRGAEFLASLAKDEFDPKKTAYVDKADFQVVKPAETAYAKVVSYKDEKLELEANATGNNFLFFSANYMPFGWKALVDGKETLIHKTNHAFMGIVVPDGKHKVEFIFAPSSFTTGKYISLILNILLFAGIITVVVLKRKKNETTQVE